jgi:L-fuconolactonase
VAELIECFGPSRCMFASNFPVDRLAGDFASVYDLALGALSDLPEVARAEVLGGTARRFYRLTR